MGEDLAPQTAAAAYSSLRRSAMLAVRDGSDSTCALRIVGGGCGGAGGA